MSGLGLTFLRRGGQAHPTKGSDYILSEDRGDPEVFRILMAQGVSSNGVGITKDDAARVTSLSTWFYGNTSIVEFPELKYFIGLKSLATGNSSKVGVFRDCTSLVHIALPDGVPLGERMCQGCTSLQIVDGIEKVQELPYGAFSSCSSLAYDELNMPNLRTLGMHALTRVPIKVLRIEAATSLPSGNNSAQNFGDNSILEELYLSNALTSLDKQLLYNYSALRILSVDWSKIKYIKSEALYKCKSLVIEELRTPVMESTDSYSLYQVKVKRWLDMGVQTTIGTRGLDTAYLEEVVIPVTATSVGTAFQGYSALRYIKLLAEVPPTLSSLSGTTCPIYVPDASVDAYKIADGWSSYASRIKPLSEYNG